MKIVTHSGSWHADEVLAIALLAVVFREVPEVTRTRDPKVIQEALQDKNTYVLDVGGQYHPLHKNFDHHQRGFEYLNHKGNKLSTFGLVVKYLRGYFTDAVYESLLEFSNLVDKHDNGIERSPELLWISDMNALEDFPLVLSMADSWLEAKILLWEREEEEEDNLSQALENLKDGVVWLDKRYPVDERLNSHSDLLLAVAPTHTGYAIQSLNIGTERDFSIRCPTPEAWRGLAGRELEAVTGIPGSVFCHASGFLTIADSLQTATMLARVIVKHHRR